MSANTTPPTQDLRVFLHLINMHYNANYTTESIESTVAEIKSQAISTVNEFLQPHVMECIGSFIAPRLANAVSTYYNAKCKSQAPRLPPMSNIPPPINQKSNNQAAVLSSASKPFPRGPSLDMAGIVSPSARTQQLQQSQQQQQQQPQVNVPISSLGLLPVVPPVIIPKVNVGKTSGSNDLAVPALSPPPGLQKLSVVHSPVVPGLHPISSPPKSPVIVNNGNNNNSNNKNATATTTTTTTTTQTPKSPVVSLANTGTTMHASEKTPLTSTDVITRPHPMARISFQETPSVEMIYLPGKYKRETTCRFCDDSVVVGLNDYSTLIARTTQVYDLLLHHAKLHSNHRSKQPIHIQSGVYHRQPKAPYILDHSHPIPLPLPSHLTNVCDCGQVLELEQKLIATINTILLKNNQTKLQQYLDKDTGFVNLTALSALLSTLPSQQLIDLFEDPPYQTTPIPSHDFLQATPSGDDPSGYHFSNIPECLQRMANICTRLLPCGCPCNGLRGELPTDCPRCPVHEMTEAEKQECCDECILCTEPLLNKGPSFSSGTFQHITFKPQRGKTADVVLPINEFLLGLGLNGHFVDYSKTSPDPLDPFEIDNHHPNNFLTAPGKTKQNELLEHQPSGGQTLVAKQTWDHSSLPPALSFLNEYNVCKHSHHLLCVMQRLRSNWGQGNRISFTYLRCPMCTLHIFHPLLVPYLVQHHIMEQYVTAKAVQRLEYDGMLKAEEILSEHSEFYQDPVSFALKQYVYYLCSTCQKPYFGGAADCQMDNQDQQNNNNLTLVCSSCCPTPGRTCDHSEEFLVHKCKFCCSHSTYVCWSNTWFCNECHAPARWPTLVYSRSGKNKLDIDRYIQCPSLQRQIAALQASPQFQTSKSTQLEQLQELRCDAKECPLRVPHPPNGFNFVIGCKQCESEGLTDGVMYESDEEDDLSKQPEIVRLQGVKQKRVKSKRKKGPRMKKREPLPSPYIVPFFEMESKIFHQLGLYSFLFLFRVLYDRHFILPNSHVYNSYLTYNQNALSKLSPLISELFQTSGLQNKILFSNVLPFTTVREDNSSQHNNSNSNNTSSTTALTAPSLSTNNNHKPTDHSFHIIANPPTIEQIIRNNRVVVTFSPQYDNDHNGIFYFLGTMAHSQPYINPHKRGLVDCSSSTDQADFITLPAWGFIERDDVRHVSEDDNNEAKAAYTVDLKAVRMAPTHYSLKHYTTRDEGCIRSWTLEGYNGSWHALDVREHDYSLNGRNSSALFACHQTSFSNYHNNNNNNPANNRYFTQFRIRIIGVNSRRQYFLAVNGFELYGTVEFPTINELLSNSLKHYTESANNWRDKIPRTRVETHSTLTSTILIPNCLRFVLDHGVRFLSVSDNSSNYIRVLFQEEAFRSLCSAIQQHQADNAPGTKKAKEQKFKPSNKYKNIGITTTSFLPVQLPSNAPGDLKQSLLLTRNFSHNAYHNNRLDLAFMVSYNEPMLLSIIATLNSLFSSPTPSIVYDSNEGNNNDSSPDPLEGYKADVYQSNVSIRGQWPLLTQFGGTIVPSLEFIMNNYNLNDANFRQQFSDKFISHLKSQQEQDRFVKMEMEHHSQLQHQRVALAAREEEDEEEAQRQRRHKKEQDRIAKYNHELALQQQQLHDKAAADPESASNVSASSSSSAAAVAAAAKVEKEKQLLLEQQQQQREKDEAKKKQQQQQQHERDEKAREEILAAQQRQLAVQQKQQDEADKARINSENSQMVLRGLRASRWNPVLLHKTVQLNAYKTYENKLNGSNVTVQNGISSGGILYYLGTLNHTDLVNIEQIRYAQQTDEKGTKSDSTYNPAFNFTNPAKLGAVAVSASSYPYQSRPLYSVVDSLNAIKNDPCQLDRTVRIDGKSGVSFTRETVQTNSLSASAQANVHSQPWLLIDFGAYRVHITGYSIHLPPDAAKTFMSDWVLEGSNGYVTPNPDDIDSPDFHTPGSNALDWKWVTLSEHRRDTGPRFSTTRTYHIDFAQALEKSDHLVKVNRDTFTSLINNYTVSSTSPDIDTVLNNSFRYLRLRSLTKNSTLALTSIEFFGSVYSTLHLPDQHALTVPIGFISPIPPPNQPIPSLPPGIPGGKSQFELLNKFNRKLVYCDLDNRTFLNLHAKNQLFFKSGLFVHSWPHINGGSSNGSGFGPGLVANYIQTYGAAAVSQQFCLETIVDLDDTPTQWNTLLPNEFTSLFEYFRFPSTHERFSCYSGGLPGLCVSTFKEPSGDPHIRSVGIFQELNQLMIGYKRSQYPHAPIIPPPQGWDYSSGNVLQQLKCIYAYFTREAAKMATCFGLNASELPPAEVSTLLYSNIPQDIINAPFPTLNDGVRFTTAVYASSTHSVPIFTKTVHDQDSNEQKVVVIDSPPTLEFQPFNGTQCPTQYTLPSILTSPLSTPQNNIIWSSSPSMSFDKTPYVIIDMGQYQRVQLTGYKLTVHGAANDVVYPRNFQLFGSINGTKWYIISAHTQDQSLSRENPTMAWGASPQKIGTVDDVTTSTVCIPVEDTMTPTGVPLYFPAYRFFCFISTGPNSGGFNNQLMLSNIDLQGLIVSSSAPLSTLPFPYDPMRYSSCIPPSPC